MSKQIKPMKNIGPTPLCGRCRKKLWSKKNSEKICRCLGNLTKSNTSIISTKLNPNQIPPCYCNQYPSRPEGHEHWAGQWPTQVIDIKGKQTGQTRCTICGAIEECVPSCPQRRAIAAQKEEARAIAEQTAREATAREIEGRITAARKGATNRRLTSTRTR